MADETVEELRIPVDHDMLAIVRAQYMMRPRKAPKTVKAVQRLSLALQADGLCEDDINNDPLQLALTMFLFNTIYPVVRAKKGD